MPRSQSSSEKRWGRSESRRLKELEFLAKSSHALNSTLDLTEVLKRIVTIVKDALLVETVSVLLFDKKRENMVFEIAHGQRGEEIVGRKIPLGEGVVGWVARNRRPLVVNDLKKDKRYSARIEEELGLDARSIMSIPLNRGNRLIGVLEAVNRHSGEVFDKEDLDIFLALGDHVATAIENARLYREAERRRLESSLLYDVSVALGKALTIDEVLEQILASLKRLIPYDAAAIFILDPKKRELVSHFERGYDPGREDRLRLKLDEGIVGWASTNKQGAIVPDTSADPRYVSARRRTRSEMVAPMFSRGKVIGLFNLESDQRDAYSEEDLILLQSFATHAGVSIERARLYEEERVKRAIERELKLARTVQQFFTPRKTRKLGKYTLTGRNYPSLELSGDYVDVFPLKKPYVAFAVADVAGKGVPASIIMASLRATLHTIAPDVTSARDIAVRANQILLETVRPHDFVTAFIGVLNPETGEVTYCDAGHDPPILMKPDGRYELLQVGGPVLGVLKDNKLEEGRFMLGEDLLFAYTDGTIDSENPAGEPFGKARLIEFLRENRSETSTDLCTLLRTRLLEHMQGVQQVDDMTFLALRE